MKKASMIAIFITTFFYLCFRYSVFGNNTPGNILAGFGFYEQYWLIDFANACIVLHLVGGYQMFNQPVFGFVEKWIAQKYPNSSFANNPYGVQSHTYHHPKSISLGNASEELMLYQPQALQCSSLQSGVGSLGGLEFLATGHLFPCGDVLCAKKDWDMDFEMGGPTGF